MYIIAVTRPLDQVRKESWYLQWMVLGTNWNSIPWKGRLESLATSIRCFIRYGLRTDEQSKNDVRMMNIRQPRPVESGLNCIVSLSFLVYYRFEIIAKKKYRQFWCYLSRVHGLEHELYEKQLTSRSYYWSFVVWADSMLRLWESRVSSSSWTRDRQRPWSIHPSSEARRPCTSSDLNKQLFSLLFVLRL